MYILCKHCEHCTEIEKENRIRMSQENKEILNLLEKSGIDLGDFCYCKRKGFIESKIARKECSDFKYNTR